ncbi:MAG: hypothetical protein ACJAZ4_000865 [Neptuniibacter pectenicola]|jgi:hypothetical protein
MGDLITNNTQKNDVAGVILLSLRGLQKDGDAEMNFKA